MVITPVGYYGDRLRFFQLCGASRTTGEFPIEPLRLAAGHCGRAMTFARPRPSAVSRDGRDLRRRAAAGGRLSRRPAIPDRQEDTVAGGTTTAGGTAGNSGGGPPGAGPDRAGETCGRDSAGRGGAEASPAAKLTGFLVLLVLVFLAAYAAGARLGPVTTGHSRPGHSQPMNMNMGAPARPAGAWPVSAVRPAREVTAAPLLELAVGGMTLRRLRGADRAPAEPAGRRGAPPSATPPGAPTSPAPAAAAPPS